MRICFFKNEKLIVGYLDLNQDTVAYVEDRISVVENADNIGEFFVDPELISYAMRGIIIDKEDFDCYYEDCYFDDPNFIVKQPQSSSYTVATKIFLRENEKAILSTQEYLDDIEIRQRFNKKSININKEKPKEWLSINLKI